jgi:hypothetical protein
MGEFVTPEIICKKCGREREPGYGDPCRRCVEEHEARRNHSGGPLLGKKITSTQEPIE